METDGSGSGRYGTFGASDIAGVALNLDDDEITIYKNGSAIVTDFALSTTKNTLFVWVMGYNSGSDLVKVNFGGTVMPVRKSLSLLPLTGTSIVKQRAS